MSTSDRADRCPGITYTDMLKVDTRPVPDFLLEESNQDLGDESISVDRYIDPAFEAREYERLWPNIWQFAAREEDMPESGDTVVYEIGDKSFLLIRQADGDVRAFYNVCLHRGRKLKTKNGKSINLRCPFHGFTWNNDGSLKEIPCQWDFRHLDDKPMSLPELRVERWQGFIMVTENHDLPDFRSWIGPAVAHYDRWRLDECYTAAWIGRVIPANWKVTAEAFMEAWHTIVTHPQILPFTADANTRYDLYGDHMNRAITPSGALSPHLKGKDQFYVIDKLGEFLTGDTRRRAAKATTDELKGFAADDPLLARKLLAQGNRESFTAMNGYDHSDATDSEMIDNLTYNIFPNFSPWGGFMPIIVYRWRPAQDVNHCLMEVRIMMRAPKGEKMPRGAEMHLIPSDQPFSSAAHIIGPGLAGVFDQDMENLPHVQQGMKGSKSQMIELGHYQESRIRQFHRTLDKYMAGDLPKTQKA
jgi:phenylpropionate dioxygenase-like ring-hydroxylating dioxygenase large terminal subunit